MTDGIDNQLPPPGNGATPAAPEGRDKGEGDAPTAPQVSRILSSGEFIARRTPRIKLVEQIITRGWCYSLTAPTGHGKSSILLRLAYAVATGQPFGPYATKQARALYLVGENDGGVMDRWLLMADRLDFDPYDFPVDFDIGPYALREQLPWIEKQTLRRGEYGLVLVDTSADFARIEDANSNVDAHAHALVLRQLTQINGNPATVASNWPVKRASRDNLIPSGGGDYMNHMDGNFCCWSEDREITHLHWQGKLRGPDFDPVPFALELGTCEALREDDGSLTQTVYARPMSASEEALHADHQEEALDTLLVDIFEFPTSSIESRRVRLDWKSKSTISRRIEKLANRKLVTSLDGKVELTGDGKKRAKEVRARRNAQTSWHD